VLTDLPNTADDDAAGAASRGRRREEILATAASQFAASGYVLTSLKDIADACGILPGSLYHHFESKDAIAVELVERYRDDVDVATARVIDMTENDPRPLYDQLVSICALLSEIAVRHVAAVQLTLYEPHQQASDRLVVVSRDLLTGVENALAKLIARRRSEVRPAIEPDVLAIEICETMARVSLNQMYARLAPSEVGEVSCHILLRGVADRVSARALDRSGAMRAANQHIQEWAASATTAPEDRMTRIRTVARAEFARRGYEATTIRHVAAAVGKGAGSIYRFIGSKQALLESIMDIYFNNLSAAYAAVVSSNSTPAEQLDALTWLNISAQKHFNEEYRIQLAWLRETPPDVEWRDKSRAERARMVTRIVERGLRSGELRFKPESGRTPALASLAMCIRGLMWPPLHLVEQLGPRAVLGHARSTLLEGALKPIASKRTVRS
jgi:AcrR family transcriptional regulator